MFRFVVRHLRFLAKVPGLPHVFEGLMLLWNTLFDRRMIGYVQKVEAAVTAWPGVSIGMHRFGGTQFNLGRREIGHIHGNGLVDILFTKQIKEELVREGRAQPHHVFPKSNWISFFVRSEGDLKTAIELLRVSYERHRSHQG